MDRIVINSRLFRLLVSKIVGKMIKKSTGADTKCTIKELELVHKDGNSHINVNLSLDVGDSEIVKLMKLLDEKEVSDGVNN